MRIPMTEDHMVTGSGKPYSIHQSKEQLRTASLQQRSAKSRELCMDSCLLHHPPNLEVTGARVPSHVFNI